jgi:hypothetical protein
MSDFLRRAVVAFAADPSRMAAALVAYRAQTGMDEVALAAWLGMDVDRLHTLALCPRPAHASPPRAADVAALAAFVGCERDRLTELLTALP